MRSGITKIVPPPEWTDELPAMDRRKLSTVEIRRPIQQNMMGTAGIFRATSIEKNKARALSVREWFDKCQDDKFASPPPKTYDRDSKEAKEARDEVLQARKEREAKKKEDWHKRREENKRRREEAAAEASDESSGPKTPEPLDPWYETTDLKTAWLPRHTSEEDYTDEACVKLQEKYWKTMGMGEPSWYGADLMQGMSLSATLLTQAPCLLIVILLGTLPTYQICWTASAA